MPFKTIPKVQYVVSGAVVPLIFELWQYPWEYESIAIGGSDESTSGEIETYELRRDQLLHARLRLHEREWPQLEAWVRWAQAGQPFDFWFNQDDDGTKRVVRLISPKLNEGIRPMRTEYLSVMAFEVTLRATTAAVMYQNLFEPRGLIETVTVIPEATALSLTIGTVTVTPEATELDDLA